jgi:hypothetical protein
MGDGKEGEDGEVEQEGDLSRCVSRKWIEGV